VGAFNPTVLKAIASETDLTIEQVWDLIAGAKAQYLHLTGEPAKPEIKDFNVYQYDAPGFVESTRWIAAANEETANAIVDRLGWQHEGGRIFTPPQHKCTTREQLQTMGVDLVLA
jgi:hypothetical protein